MWTLTPVSSSCFWTVRVSLRHSLEVLRNAAAAAAIAVASVVAGLRQETARDAVRQLGEEAALDRNPRLPEERRRVRLGEERREGGMEAGLLLGVGVQGVDERDHLGGLDRAEARRPDEADERIDAAADILRPDERVEALSRLPKRARIHGATSSEAPSKPVWPRP